MQRPDFKGKQPKKANPVTGLGAALTGSNAIWQEAGRVRAVLVEAAGVASLRGDETRARELLDLADTADAHARAWQELVHARLVAVAFPNKRPTPAPEPASEHTEPARPRRARKETAK